MKKVLIISWMGTVCFHYNVNAQAADQDIKKGNELYKQQQYEPAAAAYDVALTKDPENKTAMFNRASTTYRLSKFSEAIKSFEDLVANSTENGDKAKAYYNKGAILSNQKRLEESIEAYKNALRQDPNDKEARENLQKALLELKKKTPPPKKENEKKKKQQQNKKQQQQPKMDDKEAEQKLKLLQQKEKDLQQKMQKEKSKTTGSPKDW
ncbi:MAG TPA: tetratricopeptide repeat protein [Chitinophagaceae bacterium]